MEERCFPYAEPGGECTIGAAYDNCPPDEACLITVADLQAGATGQRCTPIMLPGEACDPGGHGLQCGLFAHCGMGACELKRSNGVACNEEDDCWAACGVTSQLCEAAPGCG